MKMVKFDEGMDQEIASLSAAFGDLVVGSNIQTGRYVIRPLLMRSEKEAAEQRFYDALTGDYWGGGENYAEISEDDLKALFCMNINVGNKGNFGHVDSAIKRVNEAFDLNNLHWRLERNGLALSVVIEE